MHVLTVELDGNAAEMAAGDPRAMSGRVEGLLVPRSELDAGGSARDRRQQGPAVVSTAGDDGVSSSCESKATAGPLIYI